MTNPAVSLAGVTMTYGEGEAAVRALRGIDLRVDGGEFVVLLGPSGSGKTTLLNVVGAIEHPTGGSVMCAGLEISRLGPAASTAYRRRQVGFVFQFFNLIPTLTALENVQLVAELTGRGAETRSEAALQAVGLGEKSHRFPSQLSGGEQQRVAIARAVVKEPALLLADEPTGSLDLETGRLVLGLLREVSRDGARTVLLVTHNAAIARMADRVVRMRSGTVVDDTRITDPVPAAAISW